MQRFLNRHLAGGEVIGAKQVIAAAGFMGQRDIAGLPGLNRQRHADQFGGHLVQTGGFRIDSDIADLINPVEPNAQRLGVADLLIFAVVEGHIRDLRCVGHGRRWRVGDGGGFAAQHFGHAF